MWAMLQQSVKKMAAIDLGHVTVLLVLSLASLCHVIHGQQQQQQVRQPLRYEIVEETGAQTFVGAVKTDAHFDYSPDVVRNLQLALLTRDALADNFKLDPNDGVLRTARVIDREAICKHDVIDCDISLEVAVSPRQYFESFKVIIRITDINDNAPVFTPARKDLSLSESSTLNHVFPLTPAYDPDSPRNGVTRYDLLGGGNTFTLQVHTNQDGTKDLRLTLSSLLDRELVDVYHLQVVAFDGGTPSLSGTLLIDVTVTDFNDNSPQFEKATYEIEVPENTPVNVTLVRLRATDADIGASGTVRYTFTQRTFLHHMDQFYLNPTTGDLILKKPLDYESSHRQYNLDVQAQDGGLGSLPTPCKVIVHVGDVNDNAPVISVTGIKELTEPGAPVTVEEHVEEGSFVAHVSIADADSGRNGQATCSVQSVDFRLEKMLENEYKLVTWSPIDRETREHYELTVSCQDQGTPRLSATARIVIEVTDANDHPPVFTQNTIAINIRENNKPGEFLVRLTATDPDSGVNGELTYELVSVPSAPIAGSSSGTALSGDSGDYGKIFHIDERTAVVTAAVALDREMREQYVLHVQARDASEHPRYAMATVTVTVDDEDDCSPSFTQKRYEFNVSEADDPGKVIGEVSALDLDLPPSNAFSYVINGEQHETAIFAVDAASGKLSTRRRLNREDREKYEFQITARGTLAPQMTDTAVVVVTVTDINDNAPRITFPEGANSTFYLSNKLPPGWSALTVQAHDSDVGINAELSFALSDATLSDVMYFVIDPKSGDILVNKDLSEFDAREFRIEVIVSDGGQPSLSTMTQLKIIVNRAVAFTEASRRDALNALAFSSGQVTIMALIIVGCIIFAIVLLCAVLVIRRREAYAKVRGGDRGIIVATLPPPANGGHGVRKSSLTANTSHHSLVNDNYYTDMPREVSCPNSLCGISQASEDEASLFSPRPVSLIRASTMSPMSPANKYPPLLQSLPYDGSDVASPTFTDWLRSENFQLQQQGHLYRVNDAPSSSQGGSSGTGTLKKSVRFQKRGSDDSEDHVTTQPLPMSSSLASGDYASPSSRAEQQQVMMHAGRDAGGRSQRRLSSSSQNKGSNSGSSNYYPVDNDRLQCLGDGRQMQQQQQHSLPAAGDANGSSAMHRLFPMQHQQQQQQYADGIMKEMPRKTALSPVRYPLSDDDDSGDSVTGIMRRSVDGSSGIGLTPLSNCGSSAAFMSPHKLDPFMNHRLPQGNSVV